LPSKNILVQKGWPSDSKGEGPGSTPKYYVWIFFMFKEIFLSLSLSFHQNSVNLHLPITDTTWP